jgi:hypothetical protein
MLSSLKRGLFASNCEDEAHLRISNIFFLAAVDELNQWSLNNTMFMFSTCNGKLATPHDAMHAKLKWLNFLQSHGITISRLEGKLLSLAARAMLIKTSLSSILVSVLSNSPKGQSEC